MMTVRRPTCRYPGRLDSADRQRTAPRARHQETYSGTSLHPPEGKINAAPFLGQCAFERANKCNAGVAKSVVIVLAVNFWRLTRHEIAEQRTQCTDGRLIVEFCHRFILLSI